MQLTRRLLVTGCVLLAACTSGRARQGASVAVVPQAGVPTAAAAPLGLQEQRLLIRQVSVTLEAEDPSALGGPITQITTEAGGFVERSSTTAGRRVEMLIRVPVAQLDAVMSRLERLGDVKERRDSARDVTEETIDVEARLRTLVALRDRLRGLLQSTGNVQDVIAVERELARVQAEVDSLEARLNYLRTHVALAQVSIRVDQRRVLGPLGWLVAGTGWVLSKLFVIR